MEESHSRGSSLSQARSQMNSNPQVLVFYLEFYIVFKEKTQLRDKTNSPIRDLTTMAIRSYPFSFTPFL